MKNPNRTRYRKYKMLVYVFCVFIFLTIVVSVEYRTWSGVFWALLFAFVAWQCNEQASISKCGLCGEEETYDLLLSLPKTYKVLNNIDLEMNGRKGEIDLLVVSEYGLFVIEVKNHSGTIFGKKGQNTWRQEKPQQTKYMKNPLHQLDREIRLLREMLASFNVSVPIQGCVYFANAKKIVTDSNNVIDNGKALIDRIRANADPILKKNQIRKIIRILR